MVAPASHIGVLFSGIIWFFSCLKALLQLSRFEVSNDVNSNAELEEIKKRESFAG
jgi:hypothetical protein